MKSFTTKHCTSVKEDRIGCRKFCQVPAETTKRNFMFPMQAGFILLIFLFYSSIAHSAAKYWIGGGGTGFYWNDATKWSDGTAPVDGDEIYFNQEVKVIFEHMPAYASYNKLYINQSDVSFRPYSDIIGCPTCTPSTFIIGDGDNTTIDFFIAGKKNLFLGHDWGLEFNLILTAGSTARIEGRLTIFLACTYNTNAAGTVTNVINDDPVSGLDHINGRIDNFGACISNTSDHLIFNDRTRYMHVNWNPTVKNDHTIPAALWNSTSTVYIQWANPNINPFVAKNMHQDFGNIIWDVTQKTDLSLADTLIHIYGSLNIINTAGFNLQLTKPASAGLTIGGSLIVLGDTVSGKITNVSIDGGIVNIGQNILITNNNSKKQTPAIVNKPGAFKQSSGTVNITEALIINAGCSYRCTNSPAINIKGNLINSGSYFSDNETFTCNGSSAQFIGGSNKTTFKRLTINNAAGVTLQTDAEVINSLLFNIGKLSTIGGDIKMILGTTASISGAGPTKYVNGRLGIRIPSATASKTFDIGDASSYTPVTLAFSGTATNNTGMIVAQSISGDHPNIGTNGVIGVDPLKSVNRYYTLTNTGVTFGSYGATFTFINPGDPELAADPSLFIVQRFKLNNWYPTNTGARTSTTTQFTGGSVNDFGDFQIGQMKCSIPTATYTLTGVESNCDGRSVAIGLSGSQAGVNYQLKLGGANEGLPVSGGESALSFGVKILGGTYSVVATRALGGCFNTISNTVAFTP